MATQRTFLLLAVTLLGCSDRHTIGQENGKLGTVGNPPKADGVCNAGLVTCGGLCVDPLGDPNNCGACGSICARSCMNGACDSERADMSVPPTTATDLGVCPVRLIRCGGSCVDLLGDPNNCGGCGSVCAGSCTNGSCDTPRADMSVPPTCLIKGQNCTRAPGLCCATLTCDASGLCN